MGISGIHVQQDDERCPYPTRLSELLDVPEAWRPFVEDWRMASVARSPSRKPQQVGWFRSDFRHNSRLLRVVAPKRGVQAERKRFGQARGECNEAALPADGDRRFEEAGNELLPWIADGGDMSMCEVLDKIENRGIQKGLERGTGEGHAGKGGVRFEKISSFVYPREARGKSI